MAFGLAADFLLEASKRVLSASSRKDQDVDLPSEDKQPSQQVPVVPKLQLSRLGTAARASIREPESLQNSNGGDSRDGGLPPGVPIAPSMLRTMPQQPSLARSMTRTKTLLRVTQSLSRRSSRRNLFQMPAAVRTESDLSALDEILYKAPACATLTRAARMALAKACVLRTFEEGDLLCLPGQPMNCVYVVVSGEIHYDPQGGDAHSSPQVLKEGESLGQLPLPPVLDPLTPRTRQVPVHVQAREQAKRAQEARWQGTATAAGYTECAVLPADQWAQIMADEPRWDAKELATFLEDLPIFGQLTSEQLLAVARTLRIKRLAPGSLIYRQGGEGDDIYLVRTGYVRVLRELALGRSHRSRINRMTYDMVTLRGTLDQLATPRRWLPKLHIPELPDDADLGSTHGSGAMTHRPRLERASFPISSGGGTNLGSLPGSPPAPPSRQQGGGFGGPPDGSQPLASPMASRGGSRGLSMRHASFQVSPSMHRPQQPASDGTGAAGGGGGGGGPPRLTSLTINISDLEPSPTANDQYSPGGMPYSPGGMPYSPGGMPYTPGGTKRSLSRYYSSKKTGRNEHKLRAADTLMSALTSPRKLPDIVYDDEEGAESLEGGPGGEGVSPGGGAGGAGGGGPQSPHDALQVATTVIQAAAAMAAGLHRNQIPSLERAPSMAVPSGSPGANGGAGAGGGGNGDGVARSRAATAATGFSVGGDGGFPGAGLSQGIHYAFSPRTPRMLLDEQQVFVEMGMLGSGQVFGECAKGTLRPRRATSAVADTRVELLVLQRAEIESRLGDLVSYLWNQEPMEGEPLVTDRAIRAQLEKSMQWELYKKGLLKDVFTEKKAKSMLGMQLR